MMVSMKVTKLEHATLVFELGGKKLILDPGFYTKPMDGYQDVVAVVITHNHDDHVHENQIARIIKENPDAVILGTQEVAARLAEFNAQKVFHGDFHQIGPFSLEFFGDLHIEIHRSIPIIHNCAVLINNLLYYPGDSYTQPDREIEYLACPSSAPWLKIGDVMDFVTAIKPKHVFPTHNIHLSEPGHQLNNGRIKQVTEENGGTFTYLIPGESLEL